MVTLLGARFAMTKPPFDQKPTPPINFWTLEIGLSCSARVRRLTGILRRAHVTIFIVDYGDFQSQLSGFSRIFEDFDWAPVIFTQDVRRKTFRNFLWKYFFPKKSKIGHGITTQNWILRSYTVTEFSKTFLVFYKWPDLTDVQGIVTSTVCFKNNFSWVKTTLKNNFLNPIPVLRYRGYRYSGTFVSTLYTYQLVL